MTSKHDKQGSGTALATVGAGLALMVCCALPVLLVAGGLGAVGSVLGNGWVIGAAAVGAVMGVLWLVRRHFSNPDDDPCCPPEQHHQPQARHPRQR